ncbi:MAG: hypothetical protein F6J90_40185 [Moorea sp. SIOASIH]|uniref:hypothetical protein n=1 Tax=Moorena sp. SIOASIH TaxID=2607817 RepID=UPI0013BA2835|nr:hypothetical protein [Moorena sp. SIOASIH]NEO42210.1 hypothetical protein [Moorena sp. SIOASIH]
MGRWGDGGDGEMGEMGRWGDGEMGEILILQPAKLGQKPTRSRSTFNSLFIPTHKPMLSDKQS